MKNNTNELRRTAPQQEGELFAQLWLLDSQGCLYYDTEKEIEELKNHLKSIKQKYKLSYGKFRKMLAI